jgi:uncharacterized protein YndB with AHSA1/START domain
MKAPALIAFYHFYAHPASEIWKALTDPELHVGCWRHQSSCRASV